MRQIIILARESASVWAIVVATADGRVQRISVGTPSLLALAPDFLGHYRGANGQAGGIVSTRLIGDVMAALPVGPSVIDDLAALPIQIASPIGWGNQNDLWGWVHRAPHGELRSAGKDRHFMSQCIAREIASIFNEPHIKTEGVIQHSPRLNAIAKAEEEVEVWLMPQWRCSELLPEAFAPPVMPDLGRCAPASDSERWAAWLEKRDIDAKNAKLRAGEERFEKQQSAYAEKRTAELAAEMQKAAKRASIERRVRAEMGE